MVHTIIIMGAAGKDFHVFNTIYRHDANTKVVCFTATQIPDIAGRKYPAQLAGPLYPEGIPIFPEEEVEELIKKFKVDECVFAYSDVSHKDWLAPRRARVEKAGAKFSFPDHKKTWLKSTKPVVAVCAVRTGSGKSQTTRKAAELLRAHGLKVVVCRHPMPYGDLVKQEVQRFAKVQDFVDQKCTLEEIEDYEHHIVSGSVLFAGVDYEKILRAAEKEADVILWDGGNNDTPFFAPDIYICIADPLRPGHEVDFYPGDFNFKHANIIIINKIDSAKYLDVESIIENAKRLNPTATIIKAKSKVIVSDEAAIKGKKCLVIEDGPTTTHGHMKTGAGMVAAIRGGASEIIDPRPYLVGTLKDTFAKYPNIGQLLPAMGYGDKQLHDLEATINNTPCECVIIGTPIDLGRYIKLDAKHQGVRVTYELDEYGHPDLEDVLKPLWEKKH